jgi:hypothetical protein
MSMRAVISGLPAWRRCVAGLVLMVCVLVLAGCAGRDVFTYNAKLTVTVETPSGEVSGSSVTREIASYIYDVFGANASFGHTGEAVVVKVTPGRYLFALLDPRPATDVFADFLPKRPRRQSQRDAFNATYEALSRVRASGPVPVKYYPRLVTFGDVGVPGSVRLVDPQNLAASFGPGVTLKSITLQITDEPVTEGRVGTVLPWLEEYRGKLRLDGAPYSSARAVRSLAAELAVSDFKLLGR